MSISGALSNALTGLTTAARSAEVVSSNLANVLTDGYGRREVSLSSRIAGSTGGVAIDGVIRNVDPALLSDRRFADADFANAQTNNNFLQRVEGLLGTPEDNHSLSAGLAKFESSLVEAASRPDLNERLNDVFLRAQDVSNTLNRVSDGVQELRVEADRDIASSVDRLNAALSEVRDLNVRISSAQVQGKETASLQDLRQRTIDEIGQIVPIREVPRDRGAVALFTPGGAVLVDSTAATLDFTTTNVIMPHMTQANGMLSGLTINGIPVRTDSATSPIKGGSLGALFEIRDETGVEVQTQIDGVARDLVERYQDVTVDPTLGAADPGLFTDQGAFFDPLNEVGLSGRLSINALVDPDAGGGVWRLRDGIGAAVPGPVGDASLLQSMYGAVNVLRVPASGGFGSASRSAADLTASLLSQAGSSRQVGENSLSFATARLDELKTQELSDGVDSDYEIQRLMLIEQAYAANARMIETVDEMMQTLLRL